INVNETLFPLLRSWHMGNTGEIFLHNVQNDITFAVGPQQSYLADSSIFTAIESASAQFIDDDSESTLETVDDKGTPILAAYGHIAREEGPRLDWKFVVKKDLREIYAPLYELLTHIALIAIALLGVTTLASVLIARTLSQPLAELVRVMQSVALGNLKTKIDFTRNDEIGQLAKAFQEMIRALDKHQLELEDANAIVRNVAKKNARLVLQLEALNADLEVKIEQRTRDLGQANQRLQKLDDMKSAFLLNVSHELRNPVTSIKFNLDLLQRELIRTDAQSLKSARYMTTLTKHVDLLAHIIEDMLSLLRLEREKDNVTFSSIDLNQIIETTLADYHPRIDAAALKLTYLPTANLPRVHAEPTWLAQMFVYLLNNAILYNTPAGHIRVSTHYNGQGQIGLQIEDTGIGIAAEELEHIFERFYRGALVNESAISGTGLGLSIVKEIVHLHHGQIEVESQLNQGSLFCIWLPIDKSERRLPDHNLLSSSPPNGRPVFRKWRKDNALQLEFKR
ncbi:MAG: HAMP domain-containing sensor histidine kinase, partial [Chloroflexi bacterium]|nr:HAMP domain-containing sensor histidine kinase [Chloroflexota bacterium]